jgi:nucleoside-diphosphate-sugar epimerase
MSLTLVTGGTGFLGSALVHRLVSAGQRVRVLDNNWRGRASRLAAIEDQIELVQADIRDAAAVRSAIDGVDSVWHLASVNGTEHFYSHPDLVLDVGVRGMLNLVDALAGGAVSELFVASSSEVYQLPPSIPTGETTPLSIPDVNNPRYSYAGAKLITEMFALHSAAKHVKRVVVFRPHNVYGPDMGTEHVIPSFALRIAGRATAPPDREIDFPIEGTGLETRAFIYIDDFIDALICLRERGTHRTIYHVGTDQETEIASIAHRVAAAMGRRIRMMSGELKAGSVSRRCPDVSRLRRLGFVPRVSLDEGIAKTVRWYCDNVDGHRNARRVA